jgi:ferritin-like metal-binding protein YciE/hemerythrin superfamily protein
MRVSASSRPDRYLPPLIVDRGCAEPISLGAALVAGKKVRPDVLNLLADDHRTVIGWFDWYETEQRPKQKAFVIASILKAVLAHMTVEEEIFYPAVSHAVGDRKLVQRAIAEHKQAKAIIDQLGQADAAVAELMATLRNAIEDHIAEEEGELFPSVRRSAMDVYQVGAACAARRVELLFSIVPSRHDPLKETPPMPISQDEALRFFAMGLRNIHGTAQQCRSMVAAQQERVESYPDIKAKLTAHLGEKDAQLERVDRILESLGEEPSTLKDATGTVAGAATSMMASVADDEIIKASLAAYGLANFEAAAYETLLAMAEAAGHPEAMPPLQQSLSEERAMAAFIAESLRTTGMRFLSLRSEGRPPSK